MDVKRRARLVKTILQVVRILDLAEIRAWLGGGWALEAQDPAYQNDNPEIKFYVYAQDASLTRIFLTEAGFSIVDVMPNSFAAERGRLYIRYELLWLDENGMTITFADGVDKPTLWPKDAFVGEKKGLLEGVALCAVCATALRQQLHDLQKNEGNQGHKQRRDAASLKALVHDRM